LTVGGMREIPAYSYGKLPRVRSVDAIQKLVIEEGVEKISAEAFIECRHPEFLTIPASVKTIGDCAFRFCCCGVNNGKNVLWSLEDGVLTFKKKSRREGCDGLSKRFFDWLNELSSAVQVSF